MITRIVKMHFQKERLQEFLRLFASAQKHIAAFDGCKSVELKQDSLHENILFTISIWESSEHLEQYRKSDLFKSVWQQTKQYFESKAEAWSLHQINSHS